MKKYTNLFALVSLCGIIIFIILVFLLHFLRKDLYFPEHFVSEYANGKYSLVQTIAFLSLSTGQLLLFLGLKANIKISIFSLIFFAVWCISLFLLSIFPTNLPGEVSSTVNNIHNFAALFAFLSLAIAMITWGKDFRKHSNWHNLSKFSQLFGILSLLTLIALVASSPSIVGLVQRLLICIDLSWLMVISFQLRKLVL